MKKIGVLYGMENSFPPALVDHINSSNTPGVIAEHLKVGHVEMALPSGYDVIIDRVGNAPLNQCIVTSVRNPQTQTRTFWVDEGKHRRLVTVVVSRSINVTLNCDV